MNRAKLRELLRRLIDECDGNNAAAKKLGVTGPYLSQIMSEERTGEGGKIIGGLLRLYPEEARSLYGGATPPTTETHEESMSDYPERYPNRTRAIRAWMVLHNCSEAEATRVANAGCIALDSPSDMDVDWWMRAMMRGAAFLAGESIPGMRRLEPEELDSGVGNTGQPRRG